MIGWREHLAPFAEMQGKKRMYYEYSTSNSMHALTCRLASVSCYVKFDGHNYMDAPEYLHVPLKYVSTLLIQYFSGS
jgi:hypothetical protein